MREIGKGLVAMIFLATTVITMVDGGLAQPIRFPIVVTSAELAQFGLSVLKGESSKSPPSFHLCYDYGAGGDLIAVSHERLVRYRDMGFTLNSLCLGLLSETKFDPETGNRLPTFIVAKIDSANTSDSGAADKQNSASAEKKEKVTVVTYEHPIELPICYRRALPFTDCNFDFDRLTGKRLSPAQRKNIHDIGLAIDNAMEKAISQRLVCTWPFCFERWPKTGDYWTEGSLAAGGFEPAGCWNPGYVPAFFERKLTPRGIPTPEESELRALDISCYDISINLPAGYGYTTDADGTAGSFISPELVKLAVEPQRRVAQIDPKALAALLKSYSVSNAAGGQRPPTR
jgi:hypothetical protein